MPGKKSKKKKTAAYETYALSDSNNAFPESKASIPTERGVKEAKDWVDHNEK